MFKGKLVLILDLDDTLIHTTRDKIDTSLQSAPLSDGDRVYFRPHLSSFLLTARNRFNYIILWSCGEYDYVHEVVGLIKEKVGNNDLFDYIFTDRDASSLLHKMDPFPFKDIYGLIDELGFNVDDCIMLDDGTLVSAFYPEIVHQVPKFLPSSRSMYDIELLNYKKAMDE